MHPYESGLVLNAGCPSCGRIILARNLHERQLERGVVGNNTPAIMVTLCFVGGKERQKSRIMRDVFENNVASVSHCISLLCRVIA